MSPTNGPSTHDYSLWQDKRWWDYRALFRDRPATYRLTCNLLFSVLRQSTGQAVLALLLSAVLDTAGIRYQVSQTNIDLGLVCLQYTMAVTGAFLVDPIGRRQTFIFTMSTLGLVWLGMTVATSQHEQTGSVASARAILTLICIFDIIFAGGLMSLVVLYPIEVLSFEMMAMGLAFSSLVVNAAGLVNQFAWPVALASIGWKIYIILMFWCFFRVVIIYLYFPETRRHTVSNVLIACHDYASLHLNLT